MLLPERVTLLSLQLLVTRTLLGLFGVENVYVKLDLRYSELCNYDAA